MQVRAAPPAPRCFGTLLWQKARRPLLPACRMQALPSSAVHIWWSLRFQAWGESALWHACSTGCTPPRQPAACADTPCPHSWRLIFRGCSLGRQRRSLGCPGLGHRRLHPHSGRPQRTGWLQKHGSPGPHRRHHPLVPTLDTACAITRSVRDAVLLHEILADRQVTRIDRPLNQWRLAVPRQIFFEQIEPAVKVAFERSVAQLQAAGASIEWIDLPELEELDAVNIIGGFSPQRAMPGTVPICRTLPRPHSMTHACARASSAAPT